ncbi:glypican-5-like isoform X1 [Callorhinchus milii]|uniref:glypican-5-like isoform X1 n=1 Tax=Callorhinchus milii TaxID=7868 RepID=UPI001C3F5562|nr:glypican-5-like isoform X1 [Callorhinchus milii]
MGLEVLTRVLVLLLVAFGGVHLRSPSCHEVRTAFQLRQIGPLKFVPDIPGTDENLHICLHKGPTCCTKRMEDRYQVVVRREVLQNIQSLSFELKYRISQNNIAFQEAFKSLIRTAKNHTNSLFEMVYRTMAKEAKEAVTELFTDISLYVLDSGENIEDVVLRYFDSLFPLVYNRLIHPGLTEVSQEYIECLRMTRRDINPFGANPMKMVAEMSRSLQAMKTLLQALNIGNQVINITENVAFSRECTRALVKMEYCSHCQGLTLIKPCVGYCLNVMRGCLANAADIDPHWREYILTLDELTSIITSSHGVEQTLLGVGTLVNEAILHAQLNGPQISTTVSKVCGQPQERATAVLPTSLLRAQVVPDSRPQAVSQFGNMTQRRSSLPLKEVKADRPRTMKKNTRDFMNYIRRFRTFYTLLAEQICDGDLLPPHSSTCWNGEDVVESYTNRVVGNGLKAQANNPEVKVRGPDPVIKQLISKLLYVNKMLHSKTSRHPEQWSSKEVGSGQGEDLESSGDCDDEDGCTGSGSGESGGKNRRKNTYVTKEPWVIDRIVPDILKGEKMDSSTSTVSTTPREARNPIQGTASSFFIPSSATMLITLVLLCPWLFQL